MSEIEGYVVVHYNADKIDMYMKTAEKIADMPNLSYGDTRVNGYWDSRGFHKKGHQSPWQLNRKPIGYIACNTFVWYSLDRSDAFEKTALDHAYKSFATTNFKSDGEIETLKKMGFVEHTYRDDESQLRYGDIMWKNGHTGFYYKKGYVLSAHVSSKSMERCVGPEKMKKGYWKKYYRLPKDKKPPRHPVSTVAKKTSSSLMKAAKKASKSLPSAVMRAAMESARKSTAKKKAASKKRK